MIIFVKLQLAIFSNKLELIGNVILLIYLFIYLL